MDRKLLISALLTTIIICGVASIGVVPFGKAQTSGTEVSGVIIKDTVWTQADSPYSLVGNVTVANGVTLTIQAGVNVCFTQLGLGGSPLGQYVTVTTYGIEVDGTLDAVGCSFTQTAETTNLGSVQQLPISANGSITFSSTSSASIIQSANFNPLYLNVVDSSPKVFQDTGTAEITISGGTPLITNNTFSGALNVNGGSPLISNNTIGFPNFGSYGINLAGLNAAIVSDNYISTPVTISSGNPLIERNLISDGPNVAMTIYGNAIPVIENNTIAASQIGMVIYDSNGFPSPTIIYNNFEQNSQYNIHLGQPGVYSTAAGNIDAANNWWGTADASVAGQTIYDHKFDNNLGTVSLTPILPSPNSEATPNPNASATSRSSSTSSPTSAASHMQFSVLEIAIFAALIVIVALLSVIIILLLRRKPQKTATTP